MMAGHQTRHLQRGFNSLAVGLALSVLFASAPVFAHGGKKPGAVKPPVAAAETGGGDATAAALPFPVALGGPFELTDHKGQRRTSADFSGRYQIIFFGYARCDAICPVALQNALDAIDILGSEGDRIQPPPPIEITTL